MDDRLDPVLLRMLPFPRQQGGRESLCYDLTQEGTCLLQNLLTYSPIKRLSAEEAISHPYVNTEFSERVSISMIQ